MQVFSGLKGECVDCAMKHFHGFWSQSGAESWLHRLTKDGETWQPHFEFSPNWWNPYSHGEGSKKRGRGLKLLDPAANKHTLNMSSLSSGFRPRAQFIGSAYISMLTRHWFYWPHYTAGGIGPIQQDLCKSGEDQSLTSAPWWHWAQREPIASTRLSLHW